MQPWALMPFFVYILASRKRGVLYVGVTNDLGRRLEEHFWAVLPSFVRAYGCDRLVYAEQHEDPSEAIAREKRLKRWRRDWKIALIEAANPEWRDIRGDIS